MASLCFYEDDYIYNPRDTEGSNKVVRLWYDERVRYADEDIADSQCMGIVAERLIVRRLLGLEALDMAYLPKAAHAKPFGPESPILAELLMPGVFVAMALVPLSPTGAQGRPIMARLYCVSGLQKHYNVVLDGNREEILQGFSWFLVGVPEKVLKNGVRGRSWLLAANLLARVVVNRDEKTARNLVRHYIVTGDVSGNTICPIEILRKPELSKQFDDFKWIIPKENDMDIPKRKIEKPESLEEAYQIIESMRSTATKSFFRFLREGNISGAKEQYRIGADIYAREEGTNLSCLEVVADAKAQLYAEKREKKLVNGEFIEEDVEKTVNINLSLFKKSVRGQLGALDEVFQWLRLQGVDSSMMFYIMAVNRDELGIIKCCEYSSINACDEHGLTAVDMALMSEEFDAAKLLHRHGGAPNERWQANSRLAKAITSFCDPDSIYGPSKDEIKLIVAAIEAGLSHKIRVSTSILHEPGYGSLYTYAVEFACYSVIEACLKNGADANEVVWFGRYPMEGEVITHREAPWAVLSKRSDINRQKFRELLKRYGACIADE